MELSEILNSLSSTSGLEKTASPTLSSAIDSALNSGFEKTASNNEGYAPAQDLIKIAQDITNAEQDALMKEAHIYGMAVADGFAGRMSQYGAPNYSVKTSSSSIGATSIKEAMELGYMHATQALNGGNHYGRTKTASDANFVKTAAYNQGQEDAVKVASYIQGQEQAVKVASYIQGQEQAVKVASYITKVASNYEDFGFKVGNSVLKRLAG